MLQKKMPFRRISYVISKKKIVFLSYRITHLTIYNSDSYLRFLIKEKQNFEKDNINDHTCTFWASLAWNVCDEFSRLNIYPRIQCWIVVSGGCHHVFCSIDIKNKAFEAARNDHSCTVCCSSLHHFMGKTAFATCSHSVLKTTCPSEYKHTLLCIANSKWTMTQVFQHKKMSSPSWLSDQRKSEYFAWPF